MSISSTSADKRRNKSPALDPEDFCVWEMMFQAYVGFEQSDTISLKKKSLVFMMTGLLLS